jgi:SAM-dependent methyltransferase
MQSHYEPTADVGLPELRYRVEFDRLAPEIAERFIPIEPAQLDESYLERAATARASRLRTLGQRLLRHVMSDFDANALLGMYPMHLLSTREWRRLLGPTPGARLLDVGAGSGDVTAELAPLFRDVIVTETSALARRRLRRRGFYCQPCDVTDQPVSGNYDVITCLNVLDRCARPRSLLRSLRDALPPHGRLVVALALPYLPFFYAGSETLDPLEPLGCERLDWEPALEALIKDALEPLGLRLESWTRAPYVSAGDADQPWYVLDDAIVVLNVR